MEDTVYGKLVETQQQVEKLRGPDAKKPYWLHGKAYTEGGEYKQLMQVYEKLMDSEEAREQLDHGSRTFEVAHEESGVITQVKADSFEEAFFKWLIRSGYDNPFEQERLPEKDGDTIDYEGIRATFYERDTYRDRLLQEILLDQEVEFHQAKSPDELNDNYGTADKDQAFAIYKENLNEYTTEELEYHYPAYGYVKLGITRTYYEEEYQQ